MKEKALEYLNRNFIKHVGIIECIKHDEIDYIYCADDGVFIYDKTAKLYMCATDSTQTCEKAISAIDSLKLIVCHNEYEYECFKNKYSLFGLNKCYQVVWTKGDIQLSGSCEVKKLESTEENIDFIFNHYTLAFDREHIRYIVENIGMYGGYVNGKLVGFIGRHEERSLGLLEVLPEYRRMGIGAELESYLINQVLSKRETPYAHIIYGNDKSLSLQKKLGFTLSNSPVYWLFKK